MHFSRMVVQIFTPNFSKQLVRRNWQVSDAFAGRVEDSIGDSCRHADGADLTQPLGAERVSGLILFLNEDDLDVVHIGVDRDVVVRQVVGHEPAKGVVSDALLFQRRANAHDDQAEDLAPRRLRVQLMIW